MEADTVPGAAVSSQLHVGSDSNHAHPCQVPASTAAVDSCSTRTGEPHVEGGITCEQANLPATSSGLSVPITVDGARPGPPVEREGLPGRGTGLLAERLPSAPRPPLPFYPIRRSARLHKSAGNAPGTAPLADEDGLAVGNIPAGSRQHDVKTEAAGPCTRSEDSICTCRSCCFVIIYFVHACLFISQSKSAMYAALSSQDDIAIVSQKPFLWHASFWFP